MTDLTGETCLSGSTTHTVNGVTYTYCTMAGTLTSPQAIQIDDVDGLPPVAGNAASVANGNLYFGATADDANQPAIGGATYIDWASLTITNLTGGGAAPLGSVENHRILDFTANDDFTILSPGSCLDDGSALPKEDFTETYIANNQQFLYMAQERRTNNGNSVYYWLLTREPVIVVTGGDCGAQTRGEVQAKLSPGDIEIIVNFPDSSDPAGGGVFFRSFTGSATGYMPIKDAVFDTGWATTLTAVPNLAINTTPKPFGPWGGVDSHGDPIANAGGNHACTTKTELETCFAVAEFAEWAVSLETIFGTAGTCGQSLFLTGVSRSSTGQVTDPTEPSDLKDIVGPKVYSFGGVVVTASLTPSCTLDIGFTSTASSPSGTLDTSNATFGWQFFKCEAGCDTDEGVVGTPDTTDVSVANDDEGTATVTHGVGTYQAVLTVTENVSGCQDTARTNAVTLSQFSVTATAPDSCALVLAYSATQSGALGTVACAWTFPSQPSALSGCTGTNTLAGGSCNVAAPGGTGFLASIDCSDNRGGGLVCPANSSDPAAVFGPITVNITPSALSLACPATDTSTAVTYTANVSGGDGTYSYTWSVTPDLAAGAGCGISSSVTCTVDFAASDRCATGTVQVTVDDTSLCPAVPSETETVTKTTNITATNN